MIRNEGAPPGTVLHIVRQISNAPRSSTRISTGSVTSFVSTSPSQIPGSVSCSSDHNKCSTPGQEHVNVHPVARTDQTSHPFQTHKEDTSILKMTKDMIDQIVDALKKDAETCEARMESKLQAGLLKITGMAKLHASAWQTNFDSRLRAVEEDRQDYVKLTADFENQFSALEGRIGALPGLRLVQQHSLDLKQETERIKIDMANKMYQLEDQLGDLQETIHEHKVAHNENLTNLKTLFEDKVVALKSDLNAISFMHVQQHRMHCGPDREPQFANSKLQTEMKLGNVDSNIDLIASTLRATMETKLSDVLHEFPNAQGKCIIQRAAAANASVQDAVTPLVVPLDACPKSRVCHTIMEMDRDT